MGNARAQWTKRIQGGAKRAVVQHRALGPVQGFTLALPAPISTNHLYFNRPDGGRGKTERYRAWEKNAEAALWEQRPRFVPGQVRIAIVVTDTARRDIDNCTKAAIDFLVTHNLIEDDDNRFVRGLTLDWDITIAGMTISVTPEPQH